MIKKEYLEGGLVKTWSDKGVYIHGGYPQADYEEVIDPVRMNRTYVETDRPIEDWSEPEDMTASRNIPSDQFFAVGKNLYYSTKTIVMGEDIVVGENCEETDIANALNDIKEN